MSLSSTPADHYTTLELPLGASNDDVKCAYRRLSRIWHPDRNGDPEATKKFQAINNAYQALCAASEPGTDVLAVQAPLLRVYRTLFDPSSLQLNWGSGAAPDPFGAVSYRLEVRIARFRLGPWTLLYEGPNSQFTATEVFISCLHDSDVMVQCIAGLRLRIQGSADEARISLEPDYSIQRAAKCTLSCRICRRPWRHV